MIDNNPDQYFFLTEKSKLGDIIKTKVWTEHELGHPNTWEPTLKLTLGFILNSNLPIMLFWGNKYHLFYNDNCIPLLGITDHSSIVGNEPSSIFNNKWAKIKDSLNEGLKGNATTIANYEIILSRKGYAEDCYFDFSFNPIPDENGKVKGVLVICNETSTSVKAIITQRDFAQLSEELAEAIEEYATTNEELSATNEELLIIQQDLQKSEKLNANLAAIVDSSDDAIIGKTLDSVITSWNNAAQLMFGYSADEIIGETVYKLIPSDRSGEEANIINKLKNGERVTHFETKRLKKDGTLIDVSLTISPIKDNYGNIIGLSEIARNITEIKKGEERSAKLAAIIESSDDAIISKTLESVITSWNDSAKRIFGYDAKEMIGESIYKLIPPDRKEEEPHILNRLKNGERVEHFETKRLTKYGKLIDVSLTISPVKDNKGNIIGLSKIARDITTQKLEEQRKNDFVAMVSHELKTPLTTISSYVQLLLAKSKIEGDEFRTNALTRTHVQTKKMVSMIHDFLSIARLDDGKITLHQSVFELHPLIEEVVEDAKILSVKHEILITDCEEITLYADRDKIGQVLNNLLSNAIKYSPTGGKIILGCIKINNEVKIFVKDEGVGISLADQKQLSQRFFRSDNERLKGVSGFGIGLYLVSEILRFHHSKIELESVENIGSTFFFLLPIHS